MKDVLKRNGFDQVEVGTTETFQGREKRVIIVTTVRAQKDLLLFDKRYKLGFVKNEKVRCIWNRVVCNLDSSYCLTYMI